VTHLRKLMLEEVQRLDYSEETIRSYIHAVEDFSRRFNCPPDRLGPRHIRECQVELFQKRKLSPGSVAVRLAPLRFFYTKTLRRAWSVADTPYPKRTHRLPAFPEIHGNVPFFLYFIGPRIPLHPAKGIHLIVGFGGGEMEKQSADGVCLGIK
jgi:hypothetical protein